MWAQNMRAVSSCSAGMHLACKVLKLDHTNELITSPISFSFNKLIQVYIVDQKLILQMLILNYLILLQKQLIKF